MPVTLNVAKVIKSWQLSIFSYEWLNKDGTIKDTKDLKDSDQEKRHTIETMLQSGDPLEAPILGIGIQDNIEIGSGKALLCTLAAHDTKAITAHIPKSNADDFKDFLA